MFRNNLSKIGLLICLMALAVLALTPGLNAAPIQSSPYMLFLADTQDLSLSVGEQGPFYAGDCFTLGGLLAFGSTDTMTRREAKAGAQNWEMEFYIDGIPLAQLTRLHKPQLKRIWYEESRYAEFIVTTFKRGQLAEQIGIGSHTIRFVVCYQGESVLDEQRDLFLSPDPA